MISKVPQRTSWDLQSNLRYARAAEAAGFEYALTQIRFTASYGASGKSLLPSPSPSPHPPMPLPTPTPHCPFPEFGRVWEAPQIRVSESRVGTRAERDEPAGPV